MRKIISKTLITMSLVVGSLLLYAQGVEVIDIDTKLQELPSTQAEHLEYLVYKLPNSLFINAETNKPDKLHRDMEVVEVILLNTTEEFVKLAKAYKEDIGSVKLLNITWDGSSTILLPGNILEDLLSLEYVYIRSMVELDGDVVRINFIDILNELNNYNHIGIIYETLEQDN